MNATRVTAGAISLSSLMSPYATCGSAFTVYVRDADLFHLGRDSRKNA
jgi:hypothetical protein